MNSTLPLVQTIFLILLSPAVSWFIKKMKAVSQNRIGPSLIQVYSDLLKLFRKGMVVSETASWIFSSMPYILFVSALTAAALVPVLRPHTLLGFAGDAILLVYVFALGRFFLALASLDTGTPFGGMGSSREMSLSSLAEPALLLSLFALSFRAKTLSLGGMVLSFAQEPPAQILFFTSLAFGALLIVTIAESGRIPVDNPATHLELTMIHEAMILEYSGRNLALIEWGHQIKQLVLLSLMANLFFPWGVGDLGGAAGLAWSLLCYLAKVFFLAFVVGWIEIHSAKLRLFRVPDLLAIGFVLSILALLGQLIMGR